MKGSFGIADFFSHKNDSPPAAPRGIGRMVAAVGTCRAISSETPSKLDFAGLRLREASLELQCAIFDRVVRSENT